MVWLWLLLVDGKVNVELIVLVVKYFGCVKLVVSIYSGGGLCFKCVKVEVDLV